jgi:hypothetical protein
VIIAAATALSGCAAPAEPTPPTEPTLEAEVSPEPAAEEPAPVANDICDLLTDDEINSVIGTHYLAESANFGGLDDEIGGQCIWTTNPEGDIFDFDASQVELVVWVPGSVNPPPADAPLPGSPDVVTSSNGAMFASADRVFWVRATGDASSDPAVISAVQALVPTIVGRL